MPCVGNPLNFPLAIEKHLQTAGLFRFRDGVNHCQGWRVWPGGILEAKNAIVLDLSQQVHGLNEIIRGLAGKSYDDIGRNSYWPARRLDPGDSLQIPVAG